MFKKIHFFTEYAVHYFRKYFLFVATGCLVGSVLFFQKDKLIQLIQTIQPKHTHIGIEGLYTIDTLPASISGLISYGLTISEEDGRSKLSPITESLTLADNNLSYLFTLKDNQSWHSGKKLEAKDITINIPGTKTIVVSPRQLKIVLQSAYVPLLSTLTKPIFLRKTLTGLGPYRVGNVTYQDGYLKTLDLVSVSNSHEIITYHFYTDSTELVNAFKLGQVDSISPDILNDSLSSWPNIKISQQIETNKYIAIFFNTEKITNKALRQALSYAAPKSEDKNDRCLGPISPNNWAYNPQVKEYAYNPTRAKELFEANKIDHINLIVGDRRLLDLADSIKKSWQDNLGLKVDISVQSSQIDSKNFEAILTYGLIPTDPDQYTFWHSTQTKTNITHLNNSRIDKLLEEGRQSYDEQQRKNIYYDFQRFLLEESPVIFLKFPTTYTYSRLK